jgi:hypothetical protein
MPMRAAAVARKEIMACTWVKYRIIDTGTKSKKISKKWKCHLSSCLATDWTHISKYA